MGASGGGPHALRVRRAAARPRRGAVCLAGARTVHRRFDWYAGMVRRRAATAADGREARARYAATETFDENSFTAADWAALDGRWGALGADAARASPPAPTG